MARNTLGYEVFRNETNGWPGSRFAKRSVELQVRRIADSDRNEAQIEIHIHEISKGGRLMQHVASFAVAPADAQRLVDALLTPWNTAKGELAEAK